MVYDVTQPRAAMSSDRASTPADPAGKAPPADAAAAIRHERREARKARARIEARDLGILTRLPLWLAVAWGLPQARWPTLARYLAGANPALPGRIRACDPGPGFDAEAIAAALEANRVEHSFQYLRDYRPGGWRFPVALEGLEHLAEARAAGRGVVLWMAHFVFHGLAAKKLLAGRGFRVHHLSRPEHGYSKTAFGIRVLNPVRRRVEDRYLASRILITGAGRETLGARLRALLAAGEIVSITAGAWEGRRVAHVPFLGGRYPLATGAPFLAHAEGAALIPVFCWRGAATDGGLTLRVGRPIPAPREADRTQAIEGALAAFMARHEAIVREAPGEWRGWNYLAAAATV